MSDKADRVNASGRMLQRAVKREKPFGRDERAAKESRRQAVAYGRARGNL